MNDLAQARILVVDDDAAVRALLRQLLGDAGCAVECAPNGPIALEACRRTTFALAMIDLRLPGMGGGELAEVLAREFPETAVIIATGVHDTPTAVACLRAFPGRRRRPTFAISRGRCGPTASRRSGRPSSWQEPRPERHWQLLQQPHWVLPARSAEPCSEPVRASRHSTVW